MCPRLAVRNSRKHTEVFCHGVAPDSGIIELHLKVPLDFAAAFSIDAISQIAPLALEFLQALDGREQRVV